MIVSSICNCERRKAIFGFIAVCIAFLLAYFGSDFQFGYLKTHTMLSIFTILVVSGYGIFRMAIWLQCLIDYNNKYKL